MALKVLMLRKKITDKQKELSALRAKDAEFEKREAELSADIEAAQTEEEKTAVEEAVTAFEADKAANDEAKGTLEREIADLENELGEIEAKNENPAPQEERKEERKNKTMNRAKFFGMSCEERDAFFAREESKEFIQRFRDFGSQQRAVTGGELTIPTVWLDLVREEVAKKSRLYRFVRVRRVSGNAKQPIIGDIPEAVWTAMCARINELTFGFNELDVEAHKVAGFIPICNSLLKDSDINLGSEIITVIAESIAKALDNAILWGNGTAMPLGIMTRLAQESQPADWGAHAPTWTDLHSTNIVSLNIGSSSGTEFFASLLGALGVAKPVVSSEGLFWVMNRKTHLAILAKALAFNAQGALVAGMNNQMPVIGGEIVELENERIGDNVILGGFGGNYLLAEREGVSVDMSEHVLFIEDHTVYRGKARYDGMPIYGEAFVAVNFNNGSASTTHSFPVDYANAEMNVLTVTAAASATAAGKTVLTVGNTIAQSTPSLKYKVKATVNKLEVGDVPGTGWTDLTSGTTEITAAAGVQIAVVELDGNGRVVSAGQVGSVPKSA